MGNSNGWKDIRSRLNELIYPSKVFWLQHVG